MYIHPHKKDPVGKDILENVLRNYAKHPDNTLSLEELNTLIKNKKLPSGTYTFEDISFLSGLTRQRIQQIEKNAMNKLKMLFSKSYNSEIRDELLRFLRTGVYDETSNQDLQHLYNGMRLG